jgi:3-phosphoshikimate 1-carboxyvinyltransferase
MLAGDLSLTELGDHALSDDITATLDCLRKLMRTKESDGETRLFCNESGSTLRFMIPLVGALGRTVMFEGAGRLPERPLREYTSIFEGKGVRLEFPDNGKYLPLRMSGRLQPGNFEVPGNISSQYISGLLMALSILDDKSDIVITSPLESEPYVEMTRDVMEDFGVLVEKTEAGYSVTGGQKIFRKEPYLAEPDYSHAAFWFVANYLGNGIDILDLPARSLQGDSEIVALLEDIRSFSETIHAANGYARFTISASQIPDLIPVLSIACAATHCVVQIVNGQRLRLKECDRLEATCEMLERLGAKIERKESGLTIFGRDSEDGQPIFKSCEINSFGDHRLVMAAAVAATRADGPVRITDCHAINKSYPEFFRDFRRMGGEADELNVGE